MGIDWVELRDAAREAAAHAYSPYSRLRVGAAGLTSDGRVVRGCNVENVAYPLTLCAEAGVISALHVGASGAGAPSLTALAVVAGDGQPLTPCGGCRQMLLEAGGPGLLVDTADGTRELAGLLPGAFSTGDLAARRER
jgi:cytidine deaminase